jgi:hypothetical protein
MSNLEFFAWLLLALLYGLLALSYLKEAGG